MSTTEALNTEKSASDAARTVGSAVIRREERTARRARRSRLSQRLSGTQSSYVLRVRF